jgi:kumamolisin
MKTKVRSSLQLRPLTPPTSWSVPQICTRYSWPTSAPGGGVIAIISFGGYDASDMTAYFASIGQPVPSITDVSVSGFTNLGGSGGAETTLDIQVAGAAYYAATGSAATIRVYFPDYFDDGIYAAIADGCDVFSISYGEVESDFIPSFTSLLDDVESAAAAAVAAGMTVLAASGDKDADGGTAAPTVEFPSNCPSIIGVGGTNLGISTEVVWNSSPNTIGTGGGFSAYFTRPSWQSGCPTPPTGLGRMTPDIAANADVHSGYEFDWQGANRIVGGTSAATPLWAALIAACGRKFGSIAPLLYATPSAFNDITSGNNGTYSAAVGPDPCTGMGSPIGTAILARLTSYLNLEGGGHLLLEDGSPFLMES